MTNDKFPALEQLLGCYFHQDWTDEFETDAEALDAIACGEPSSKLAAGVEEIDALLKESLSESELRMFVINRLGCYFEPSAVGLSYVDWLGTVQKKLARV